MVSHEEPFSPAANADCPEVIGGIEPPTGLEQATSAAVQTQMHETALAVEPSKRQFSSHAADSQGLKRCGLGLNSLEE
jgi:hypothetical protein